jgi:hypothetical protein
VPPAAKKATPAKRTPGKKAAAPARTRPAAAAAAAVVQEEETVPAAAPAKRRPGRPRADRPAARAAAAMRAAADEPETPEPEAPEPEEDSAEPDAPRTVMIPFQERIIEVTLPTEEQLTMYHRLSREFQALGRNGNADRLGLEEALRQLDRATRLVQSVMLRQDDRDWLEDQMLEGRVKLTECTELLKEAFKELHKANEEGMNRKQKRAASRARLADE